MAHWTARLIASQLLILPGVKILHFFASVKPWDGATRRVPDRPYRSNWADCLPYLGTFRPIIPSVVMPALLMRGRWWVESFES